MSKEIEIKQERVRKLLKNQDINGIILRKVSNFSWFTGGGKNYVGLNSEEGASSLVITQDKIFLLTNNIEAPRVLDEEVYGINLEKIILPWYEDEKLIEEAKKITGEKIGADSVINGCKYINLDSLHFPLIPEEIEKYQELGSVSGKIISDVCQKILPGMTETEIASIVANEFWKVNIIPVVILIAVDDRIEKYRHPLPTLKKLKNYAMVVVCARKYGLIASLTRLVSFGKISDKLKQKHEAVCTVDATFISESVPDNRLNTIFTNAIESYKQTGFENEWEMHHQGGPTGYQARYYRANFNSEGIIESHQAYAWNPSISGTKSEDTIITTDSTAMIITEDKKWPMKEIKINGKDILRPDILIR
ncbi:MAG: aminopeptidase P family N-terminal domain-containing protein [Candidatus Omnitrophica bacterium]|jgi:Xaa-Pro aminopeptidase|nr:aminopeptidase P family N-terminal domain-containing protein [Candidatus Omnitrophota bacterium]